MQKILHAAWQSFLFHPHSCLRFCGGMFVALAWLALSAAQAQTTNYALGTTALLEGPAAGSDAVVLSVTPQTGVWTAMTNAAWLHLTAPNQSGTGSTNVIFSYDANPGATRTGTLTIAGQTLTVTQAGSTYVPAEPFTPLVSSGLGQPVGVAVDGSGNVYIADSQNNAIKEWTAASNIVTTLVSLGLNGPSGVAVDGAGNVYIADTTNNAVEEWIAASNTVTTLVSGLASPYGLAVDGAGNVYIADTFDDAILEWCAASNTVTTLVSSGLNDPAGVAVDAAGNVYIADTDNSAIEEWIAASNTMTTLVSSGLNQPAGVAVDGAGNVYIADGGNGAIKKWTAASNTVTTLVSSELGEPLGVAVDGAGNVYISDYSSNAIDELPYAFVNPTPKLESANAGNDALPVVLPVTANLLAPFTPTSDQPWLAITGITNGVVEFSFTANLGSSRTAHLTLLGQAISITQGGLTYSLGTTALLVGPPAGSNSVVLGAFPNIAAWTNTANAAWLHLSPANQSGAGSTNVVFGYDANPGATRSGTLTIAGLTLTVTQAGSTYVAAQPVTTLVSSGLDDPHGVAVDGSGNVYIADTAHEAVKKWTGANNTVTTLVSSGLSGPEGVAVDGSGNIYIADTDHSAIKEWTVANNTVTTLVSSGLSDPYGVAVDGAGNVYIADTGHNAIKKWMAANSNMTTLVSSGLNGPTGVAVDGTGNIYIADTGHSAIKEWSAANNTVTTLVSSGLDYPYGVAVDGSGNVYIADNDNGAIKEWIAVSNIVNTLVSGVSDLFCVAVDGAGNVYFENYNISNPGVIEELPYAFVDPTPKLESLAAGSDELVVLPATANLLAPFSPTSSQSWLTISGITNGVVSFSFTATTSNRTANITLPGQTIPVTQGGPSYSLGTIALLAGPGAGSNSVVLAVAPNFATWMATTNATWLHLSRANQSGTGSTNVLFSYDANPGATRSGTLTIAGQTLTVTQAGSTYVAADSVTTLVSSGLDIPEGVAVGGSGNVYIADTYNNAIREWTATNNSLTTLVSSGLNRPLGVAVDGAGNVYIADTSHNAIKEWTAANSNVTTLVSSGLSSPDGVAVDGAGNVYIADTGDSAIKEWTVANNTVTTLVSSGLDYPYGVAVDGAGNVYIADTGNNAIKEWTVANNTVTTLVSSGLDYPSGVAVDGSGNVYIAETYNSAIIKWSAASNTVTTLVFSGLDRSYGVAVDGSGNVYIADTFNYAIKELPYAFVDPTAKSESANAGNDALPVVLPATANLLAPFTPTNSGTNWLTITGITNGVVSFSFANDMGSSTNRTANITLLGETIPVTQTGDPYILVTNALLVGPSAGSDSVVLAKVTTVTTWTATANAAWLHLSAANQSDKGSTNVVFSYDANPGATRSGTLTIAGLTLTVTQAGSTYVAVGSVITLVSSGLDIPEGVAVGGSGNVYIADTLHSSIKEWTPANHTVTTLVSSGLEYPPGVAVDGSGNVYIANTGFSLIEKWTAANHAVTTLVSSGLDGPAGVAVDGSGNVYIADTGHNAIKEWTAANSNVTTLDSVGLSWPDGVAVDGAGNVYIADTTNNAIKECIAASRNVTTLVSSGLNLPCGVAVDVSGNVYIADAEISTIEEWSAACNNVTTLVSSGLNGASGVAVDGAGNVYIADSGNNAIKELPYAFVDPTPRLESPAAGNDALPVVLPATENLLPPFAPTSTQSWLTISGITNGVVGFAFTANAGPARTANITLLGQNIPITQGVIGTPPTLTSLQMLGNGAFQFAFTNTPGAAFTVVSTTNLSLPLSDWTVVGNPVENPPGMYQFTSQPTTNDSQIFYGVLSP
jgi:DNA-binding beta-propeller fold protein YncE